jgi:hypothetical protein
MCSSQDQHGEESEGMAQALLGHGTSIIRQYMTMPEVSTAGAFVVAAPYPVSER